MSTTYAITVDGHLDDHGADRLRGLGIARNDDGTSILTGPITDQAELYGVLAALSGIGATLLSLRVIEPVPSPVLDRPLHTDRLTIRQAKAEDAEATWSFRRLDGVTEWLTSRPAGFDDWRTVFSAPARLATTAVIELDNTIIGDLMLRREDAWSQQEVAGQATGTQVELGWVLDPAHTGRGYAAEAAGELIRYCFEDLGVRRIVAVCFYDNEGSWRLMERLGMRREQHGVRDSLHRSGQWLDSLGYAILAEDWTPTRP
ncbi:GNAT family N-acetyltransferase [Winogradskya humida]|uniref:N-acetyltransferase domain-containing protein n=1 Tax=Winogradskya humida TaxID=113566 RepID=A0ABQ4A3K3_9ACTN|nr:GNAT family protein [Actinoplanes humidus]GIE24922.1 hypothetical protein Ahu01nite_080240 [Actinoplanes humidus]